MRETHRLVATHTTGARDKLEPRYVPLAGTKPMALWSMGRHSYAEPNRPEPPEWSFKNCINIPLVDEISFLNKIEQKNTSVLHLVSIWYVNFCCCFVCICVCVCVCVCTGSKSIVFLWVIDTRLSYLSVRILPQSSLFVLGLASGFTELTVNKRWVNEKNQCNCENPALSPQHILRRPRRVKTKH
uniref:Uncharacterized protein n=1 Tax=Molossus molossus TaxID=27622 RepID=A0A7J8GQ84_MOLMO|nr:hypothetical protein HJG59_011329 [Molossus molossus]